MFPEARFMPMSMAGSNPLDAMMVWWWLVVTCGDYKYQPKNNLSVVH